MIPYVGNVLSGWTKTQEVYLVQKTVEESLVRQTAVRTYKNMNLQPMPREQLNEIPQEQRSDSWYSILIKERQASLDMDDIIMARYQGQMRGYRIKQLQDWGEAGYCRYAAVEMSSPLPEVAG